MAELRKDRIITHGFAQQSSHKCDHCGSHRSLEHLGPTIDGLQQDFAPGKYSKITCADCGSYIKWGVNPAKKKKKKSRAGQADLLKHNSKGFCQICLRTEELLPRLEQLEAHHVIPVEMGGGNHPENIHICCSQCHRMIHHLRTYLGHYGTADVSKLVLGHGEGEATS